MAHTLGVGPASAAAGTATVSVVLTGTTAGRSIAVMVWFVGSATAVVTSVSCTAESNLTLIGSISRVNIGGGDYGMQLCYLSNITTSGDKTITFTPSAGGLSLGICAVEIVGGDTGGWLGSTTVFATGTSSAPSVSITTSTANEFVIGMVACNDSSQTAGSGYTQIVLPNAYWYEEGQYDLDVGAAGSKTFNFTLGGSADWGILCASFKLAAGTTDGAGSASGAGAAAGAGSSTAASPGTASGTGTASGVGRSTAASVGVAAGTGTALGAGASVAASVAAASGTGTVTGVGAATAAGVGTAAGTSEVLGVGDTLTEGASEGSASGVGTALGVGVAIAASAGVSAGAAEALGAGASTAAAAGLATGVATVAGVAPGAIVVPGLEYAAAINRLHYASSVNRLHYASLEED